MICLAVTASAFTLGCGDDGAAAKGTSETPRDPASSCGLKTGYPGDELCLEPPAPGTGLQLHFGPTRYDDPAELAAYVIQPGEESLDCLYVNTPNDEDVFYAEFHIRRRPGSHHLIVSELVQDMPDGRRSCGFGEDTVGLVGGTTVSRDWPDPNLPVPENEGLASRLHAHAQVAMQVHFFNTGNTPLLKETWMNLIYKDPATVTTEQTTLGHYAGMAMNVAPGTTALIHGSATASQDMRIVDLYSHYHMHTQRLSAWKVTPTERTLVYQSHDWAEPGVLPYDSVHQNSPPDPATRTTGGYSGLLELHAGDKLEFECEIQNNETFPFYLS